MVELLGMRRVTASLLLAVFGLPLAAFLGPAAAGAALPACCRRDGKHHCAMNGAGNGLLLVAQPCNAFPSPAAAPGGAGAPAAKPAPANTRLRAQLSIPLRQEPAYQASFSRSLRDRAPPAPLS